MPPTKPRAHLFSAADERRVAPLSGARVPLAPKLSPNSLALWGLLAGSAPLARLPCELAAEYLERRQRQPNGSASAVRAAELGAEEHGRRLLNEAVERLNRELQSTPYCVALAYVLTIRQR